MGRLARLVRGAALPTPEQETRFADGADDLRRGRPPAWVLDGVRRRSGLLGGPISPGDLLALTRIGLQPVGQVFGTATYQLGKAGGIPTQTALARWTPGWWEGERACRRAAFDRLRAEAVALGADGVLGLRIVGEHYPQPALFEFSVEGLAVRSATPVDDAMFTTHFSAAELGTLAAAGWWPVSFEWHWERTAGSMRTAGTSMRITELTDAADLANSALGQARRWSHDRVRAVGADGFVVERFEVDGRRGYGRTNAAAGKVACRCDVFLSGTTIIRRAADECAPTASLALAGDGPT